MTDERAGEPTDEVIFRAFESVLPLALNIPEAAAGVWLGCVKSTFDPRLSQDIKLQDPASLAALALPDELKRCFAAYDPIALPRSAPYVGAARRITARLHEMTKAPDIRSQSIAARVIGAIMEGCVGGLRRMVEWGVEERPFNLFRDVMRRLFDFPRFKAEEVPRWDTKTERKIPFGSDFDDRLEKVAWVKRPDDDKRRAMCAD